MSTTVAVSYQVDEAGQGSLRVEPAKQELQPGPHAAILWQFQDLPAGVAPFIEWSSEAGGEPPLGPFNDIRGGPGYLLGKGSRAVPEARSYAYRVVVEMAAGKPPVRSEPCVLQALAAQPDTTPNAVVSYAGGKLLVEPLMIAANTGDTVIWFCRDFPFDTYPVIRFLGESPYGPLASLTLAASTVAEPSGVDWVISGAVASPVPERLFYLIEARDAEHQVLAERHDPGIDNMGPPG